MMARSVLRICEIFERNRDRVFVVDASSGREFRYGDIELLSLKLAALLKKRGVRKGDTIAVILPNCIEFVLFYFACMQTGAVAVPVNPKLTGSEIEQILLCSDASIVCAKERPEISAFRQMLMIDDHFLAALEHEIPLPRSFSEINDNDIFAISYTSGTTALPKGVVVIYKNIIEHGALFGKTAGIGPDSRFYSILPAAYMGGWYNLMLIPFLAEGSIVLDSAFNPALALRFWEIVRAYAVNALWFVPTILSVLLSIDRGNGGAEYCRKNLKCALVGTAPLSRELKRRFEKKYGITLHENYGLSETLIATTHSPFYSANGVGRPLPGCEILIRADDGSQCATGSEGEIVIRTPFLMAGYYKDPEATAKIRREDGIHTGDIGFMDRDGCLFVTGRKKDLIIRGGINISPFEIEEAIASHPAVAEVAAVGIPDPAAGEEIAAVIRRRAALSENEVRDYCTTRLAPFKIPKYWEFVEDFPRSVTGKVQKVKLREIISAKIKNDNGQ